MAVLTKGVFGPISGRLGYLVFCVGANGSNYIRTLPRKVNKAPTDAQLAQRTKCGLCVRFLSPMKEILKKGFHKRHSQRLDPWNLAVKSMLSYGIKGEYPNFEIDFPKIQLSTNNLQQLTGLELDASDDRVRIRWLSCTNRFNSFADDRVTFIVYNVIQNAFTIESGPRRKDEEWTLEMRGSEAGDHLVFYAFIESEKGENCGQFIGERR
jgi:hypothetical protein